MKGLAELKARERHQKKKQRIITKDMHVREIGWVGRGKDEGCRGENARGED